MEELNCVPDTDKQNTAREHIKSTRGKKNEYSKLVLEGVIYRRSKKITGVKKIVCLVPINISTKNSVDTRQTPKNSEQCFILIIHSNS